MLPWWLCISRKRVWNSVRQCCVQWDCKRIHIDLDMHTHNTEYICLHLLCMHVQCPLVHVYMHSLTLNTVYSLVEKFEHYFLSIDRSIDRSKNNTRFIVTAVIHKNFDRFLKFPPNIRLDMLIKKNCGPANGMVRRSDPLLFFFYYFFCVR